MALIEGETFDGYFYELTVILSTGPSDNTGASPGSYSAGKSIQANVNKNATKIGASVSLYHPELAILFATEVL